MGRASKNRGPIGHHTGQVQYLPDSPGERKAPCSLAPWQLPPKVSPPDDVPTHTAHQQKYPSPRTTGTIGERLQELGEPVSGVRQTRQPHDAVPALICRGNCPHLRRHEPGTQQSPVQPVGGLPRHTPARQVVDATHPQTGLHACDVVQTVSEPVFT